MADRYLSIGVAGTNSGTLANPWSSWQSCLTNFTVGDVIYFTGNETLATPLTMSGKASTTVTTKFIACDASWVPTDVPWYISGAGAVANILQTTNCANYTWTGVIFKSTTGALILTGNTLANNDWTWDNCGFESAPYVVGPSGDEIDFWNFLGCYTLNITTSVFSNYATYVRLFNSKFISSGIIFDGPVQVSCHIEACLFHATSSIRSENNFYGLTFRNNICDTLTDHILHLYTTSNFIEYNKFTNNATASKRVISVVNSLTGSFLRDNYFYNNTDDLYASTATIEATLRDLGGNLYTGTTSTDDYIDRPSDDFRPAGTVPGTTLAVSVGNVGDVNEIYEEMGWAPEPPTTTAPTFAGITKFEILSNNKFRVEWAAGTGPITSYNIYIRNASSVFGQKPICVDDTLTSAIIHCTGEMSSLLVGGTTYYCGVRADNNGTEDANAVELSNICSGAEYIQRMNIVTPVVTF